MNDKEKNNKDKSYDLMQDTQYLLLGLEETVEESYALEDILAEFILLEIWVTFTLHDLRLYLGNLHYFFVMFWIFIVRKANRFDFALAYGFFNVLITCY